MDCCKYCKHYQGTKEEMYGDCYMVIGELVPNLFNCLNDLGYGFSLPFDPHDVKYYTNSITFNKLYSKLFSIKLYSDIEKDTIKVKDLVFDSYGRSYLKNVKMLFLRTRKGYYCSYFKRRNDCA